MDVFLGLCSLLAAASATQRNAASATPERHVVGLALRPSPAGDRLTNGGQFFLRFAPTGWAWADRTSGTSV